MIRKISCGDAASFVYNLPPNQLTPDPFKLEIQ